MTIESQPAPVLDSSVTEDIHGFFPPNAEERSDQAEMLDFIAKAVADQKRYILIEAPTGAGKSHVAMTAARWACATDNSPSESEPAAESEPAEMPNDADDDKENRTQQVQSGAYILTPTKQLQRQYMDDFGFGRRYDIDLVEVKGRSSYTCRKYGDCEAGSTFQSDGETRCTDCPYKSARQKFFGKPYGVTNYTFLMTALNFTDLVKRRSMLILDEAHNAEHNILAFSEIDLNLRTFGKLGVTTEMLAEPIKTMDQAVNLGSEVVAALDDRARVLQHMVDSAKSEGDYSSAARHDKMYSQCQKLIYRLNDFVHSQNHQEWYVESDAGQVRRKRGEPANFKIMPLNAAKYAEKKLFRCADTVLMLSATFLDFDTVMRSLGIPSEDAATLQLPCRFPAERRRIRYIPVGSMSFQHREETTPKILKAMSKILTKHATERGIVHTQSYTLNRQIVEHLKAAGYKDRLVTHDEKSNSREAAIRSHLNSLNTGVASVVLSPSMTEGLDLKDDLGRFNVFPKIPFPALTGYMRARMQRDPRYYAWLTALGLVQGSGRTNRHAEDWSVVYILDSALEQFISQNVDMLPRWWLDGFNQ